MLVWTGWLSNSDKMIFGREECFFGRGRGNVGIFLVIIGKIYKHTQVGFVSILQNNRIPIKN